MIRETFVFAVLVLFSGCICCGGRSIPGLGGFDVGGGGVVCEQPYIQVGSECCLDGDGDAVCDDDVEGADLDAPDGSVVVGEAGDGFGEEGESDEAPTTTTVSSGSGNPTTTSPQRGVLATTTTVRAQAAKTYECVRAAGWDPDSVYFGYSQGCGSKFISTASSVSIQKGVDVKPINIGGFIDDKKVALLECFYGKYNSGNPQFGQCPVLLCPRTGEVKILTGQATASVQSQMSGFAQKCS